MGMKWSYLIWGCWIHLEVFPEARNVRTWRTGWFKINITFFLEKCTHSVYIVYEFIHLPFTYTNPSILPNLGMLNPTRSVHGSYGRANMVYRVIQKSLLFIEKLLKNGLFTVYRFIHLPIFTYTKPSIYLIWGCWIQLEVFKEATSMQTLCTGWFKLMPSL